MLASFSPVPVAETGASQTTNSIHASFSLHIFLLPLSSSLLPICCRPNPSPTGACSVVAVVGASGVVCGYSNHISRVSSGFDAHIRHLFVSEKNPKLKRRCLFPLLSALISGFIYLLPLCSPGYGVRRFDGSHWKDKSEMML
ncbi:hypothetical protein ACS0TY_005228 [Phlomoides rotata]